MIVADTDVLIDALRGRDPGAGRVAEAVAAGRLATTAVSVFELMSGGRRGLGGTATVAARRATEVCKWSHQM